VASLGPVGEEIIIDLLHSTEARCLTFCGPCIMIHLRNKDQRNLKLYRQYDVLYF